MNKKELVEQAAKKAGLSQADTEKALSALTETIITSVAKGDKVQLLGFGTFGSKKRNERTAKNPKTGEIIKVAAATVAAFKVGKAFKERVNK